MSESTVEQQIAELVRPGVLVGLLYGRWLYGPV
jgi:hypothetical protein